MDRTTTGTAKREAAEWRAMVEKAADEFARLATNQPGSVLSKEAVSFATDAILDALAPDPLGRDILRALMKEILRVI